MKVTSKVEHVFTFRELKKDIGSEPRTAVITSATLTWVEYGEPQGDLGGGTTFLDYQFRGWKCTGKISHQQKHESPQAFPDHVATCGFILELITQIDSGDTVSIQGLLNATVAVRMRTEVQTWLVQAMQQRKGLI